MRALLALVLENVRRRWRELRDRRALAGEQLFVDIDQVWSRASRQRRTCGAPPRVLGGAALRSAPGGSAAPTSSLADDLRGSLVRQID